MPISIGHVMLFLVLITLGKLFIGPEGYNLPSRYAPENLKGIATGIWVSILGTASLVALFISDSVLGKYPVLPNVVCSQAYHTMAVGLLIAALVILVLSKFSLKSI